MHNSLYWCNGSALFLSGALVLGALVFGGAFVPSALVLVGVLLNLRTTGLTTLGNCSTSSFHFLLRRSF